MRRSKLQIFFMLVIGLVSATLIFNHWYNLRSDHQVSTQLANKIREVNVELKTTLDHLDLYYHTGNAIFLDNILQNQSEVQDLLGTITNGGTFEYNEETYSIKRLDLPEPTEELLQELNIRLIQSRQVLSDLANNGVRFMETGLQQNVDNRAKLSQQDIEGLYLIKQTAPLIINNFQDLYGSVHTLIHRNNRRSGFIWIGSELFIFGLLMFSFIVFKRRLIHPMQKASSFAQQLSMGNLKENYEKSHSPEIDHMEDALIKISRNFNEATDFALKIGEGKLDYEMSKVTGDDYLGTALMEMRDKLKTVAEEEKRRNWAINGIAKFSDIFRQNQHANLEELSYSFIKHLSQYLHANQGGVFLINEDDSNQKFIELTGCYAYERRKQLQVHLQMEEGLIGQCILEKDTLYLEEVPENYIFITSGLGKRNPTCILIVPVKVNDEIYGAIELAFFNLLDKYQIDFVEKVCETFASTLSSTRMNLRTKKLLDDSQAINQELQQKEEQMRQNAEELETTQEELNRKLSELEEETNLSNNIIEAINKTNATIEFDLEGNILNVNDMYLSVMGYTRDEIVGKNELKLVPKDELDSNRYRMLWDSLTNGSFMSGEYRRISKGGREVWLNGTYNPIFNIEGKPYKVIQFAQFTTEEKEKDLDLSSKINAISNSFPLIELDLEGKVKSANQEFVNLFGYKRLEVRNKEMTNFLDQDCIEQFNEIDLLNHQSSLSFIFAFRTKDENLKYCLTIFSPIRNLSGEVYKIMVILVDISQQKNLELELMANQNQLSETIAQLENAKEDLQKQKNEIESRVNMLNKAANILEIDLKGKILKANDAICAKLNISQSEIIGLDYSGLIHKDYCKDSLDQFIHRVKLGEIKREVLRYQAEDEQGIWGDTTIAPIHDVNEVPYKFIAVMFDVSSQILMQNELRQSLAREKMRNAILNLKDDKEEDLMGQLFQQLQQLDPNKEIDMNQILENDLLPALKLNREAQVVDISKSAQKSLKITRKEIIDQSITELVYIDNEVISPELIKKITYGNVVKLSVELRWGKQSTSANIITIPLFSGNQKDINIMMFVMKI
ncbi:MAG: PAS domain S-box protein [Candidatus Cyclobacteriaceae bacterium M3_2C_046]